MEAVRPRTTSSGVKEKLKASHDVAFRFIKEGLALEEMGKPAEALLCYEKGLRSLNVGLNLCTNGSESSSESESINQMKGKMEKALNDVEYRISDLRPTTSGPSAPPMEALSSPEQPASVLPAENGDNTWEDATTLISIPEGVRMFHVDSQKAVSTWSTPCELKIYQLLKDHIDSEAPPAFLQCGEWIYPLHPGKSPALKTFYRTYMFPDLSLQSQTSGPSSIGLVLADLIPEKELVRFERILSCYCDFRKLSADDTAKAKPPRPPPPYSKQEAKEPTAPPAETVCERQIVPYRPGDAVEPMEVSDEEQRHWSETVSNGIFVGAKWISWGVGKGAQVTSQLVEQGAAKLRKKLQPNEVPTKVDPQVSENVQQVKQVTGAAVQVSGFIVTTLCALTVQLGRSLSPIIRTHGSKLIPEKYKNGDESGQKTMDDLVKVAVAGLHGFGTVFNSLEEGGKALYHSVTKATVETVNHKYGEEVSEVTGHAMAAAGNTAQAYWNVKKLGAKAIAKRTAKDTGRAVLHDEAQMINNKQNRYLTE